MLLKDLTPTEKIGFVSGHDFSRAAPHGVVRALAPEVRLFIIPRAQLLGNGNKTPYLSG